MPTDTPEQGNLLQPLPEPPPAAEPPRDLWRLRDLLILIVFLPVDLFISNIVAFSGFALLKPFLHWEGGSNALAESPLFQLCIQSVFYVFLVIYIYLLVTVHYRSSFGSALHWRKITAHGAARFFLGGIALSLLVILSPLFLPEEKTFPLEKMFSSPANAYAIALFAVLVAPFMEELLFRGVLFAFFERHGGLRFAIFGTAVLFAALHVPEYWGAWNHVLLILVVGLVLSSARGMTDSLTPSVILHVAYNGTLMAMLYLQTSGFQKLPALLRF
jgi:membrane protease YdiL (CAAX protease family)